MALSVVCGAVLLLVASQPHPEAAASPMTAPAGPPTLAELKNATYAGFEEPASPVTLKDGLWEGESLQPGGTSRPRVSLGGDFHLLGDLDGDGAEEAVVVLAQSSGGSGTFDVAITGPGTSGTWTVEKQAEATWLTVNSPATPQSVSGIRKTRAS